MYLENIKLFIRFLKDYDIIYNPILLTKCFKETNLLTYNYWVRYSRFLIESGYQGKLYRKTFDLLWMNYILENVEESTNIYRQASRMLIYYLTEYKTNSHFPIKDLNMLKTLKTRIDVEELLKKQEQY